MRAVLYFVGTRPRFIYFCSMPFHSFGLRTLKIARYYRFGAKLKPNICDGGSLAPVAPHSFFVLRIWPQLLVLTLLACIMRSRVSSRALLRTFLR